jgi:hypothetical protein
MLYFTQLIFIKEGEESSFLEFESLVLPLLADYNGTLIYRIRPSEENFVFAKDELPFEVHFLSFETEQDFKNYCADNRRNEFLYLKEQSIKSSFLVKGEKV